jgi:hypothetical protein
VSKLTKEDINCEKLYNINLKRDIQSWKLSKGSYTIGYNRKKGLKIDNLSTQEGKYIEALSYNSTSSSGKRSILKNIDKRRFRFLESLLKNANYLDYEEDLDMSKSVLNKKIIAINCADKFGAGLISSLYDAGCKNIIVDDPENVLITDIGPIYKKSDLGKPRIEVLKGFFTARYRNIRLSKSVRTNLDLLILIGRFEFDSQMSENLLKNRINHIFIDLEDDVSKISPIINIENSLCIDCEKENFLSASTSLAKKPGLQSRESIYTTTEKIFSLTGFFASQIKLYYSNQPSAVYEHFTHFINNGSYFQLKKMNAQCTCVI